MCYLLARCDDLSSDRHTAGDVFAALSALRTRRATMSTRRQTRATLKRQRQHGPGVAPPSIGRSNLAATACPLTRGARIHAGMPAAPSPSSSFLQQEVGVEELQEGPSQSVQAPANTTCIACSISTVGDGETIPEYGGDHGRSPRTAGRMRHAMFGMWRKL